MDQTRIGKFISEKRRAQDLTQMQLAEKLGITDRAVSKWETGRSLPDASVMLELCDILKVTVNDLLCGEVVSMENNEKRMQNNLIEMIREKEKSDRRLLSLEWVIGLISLAFMFTLIGIAAGLMNAHPETPAWIPIVMIAGGMLQFIVAMVFALRIEQVAGYYECAECGHRYVPEYRSVVFAPHLGRTRRMKCPKCRKTSWQKKVIEKE